MTDKPENPPAFGSDYGPGMTLRDYFAAAALSGLMRQSERDAYYSNLARISYEAADAMLAARQGGGQ